MDGRVEIRAYNKVWSIEKKVYAVGNIILPRSIAPRHIAYFVVVALLMGLLPLGWLPWVLRYVAIPFGVSQFMLKVKLDGKAPQRFLAALIDYALHLGQYYAAFRWQRRGGKAPERLRWTARRGDLIYREEVTADAAMPH